MSVYDSDLGRRKLKPLVDVNYFREYSLNDKDVSTIMTHMINEDLEVTPTILNISGTDYTMTRISLPCLVTETEGSDWFSFGDTLYCTGIFTNNATGKTAASVIPYEKLYELTEYVNNTIEVLQINSPQDEITAWVESNTWKLVIRLNRLSPGPVVAKSATRQLRKLTMEKVSIKGTWLLNENIIIPNTSTYFEMRFMSDGVEYNVLGMDYYANHSIKMFYAPNFKVYETATGWVDPKYRTITILDDDCCSPAGLQNTHKCYKWLNANGEKIA